MSKYPAEFHASKIADGVHSYWQKLGGYVHAFLIEYAEGLILIDSLFDEEAAFLLAEIERLGKPLQHIIITHAHRSHIGGLAAIKLKHPCARIHAHQWEADIIAGERKAQGVPLSPTPPYEAYVLQLGLALGLGEHPVCQVDHFLTAGDSVGPLSVIATPGHTPGSITLHYPEKKILFVGDVIATWPKLEPGWKAFTLNFRQNRDSIGHLTDIRDVDVLAVGHGDPLKGDIQKHLLAMLNKAESAPPSFFAAQLLKNYRKLEAFAVAVEEKGRWS